MSPIETIARPHRNRISVSVPREYSSYSFQVILVPLGVDTFDVSPQKSRKTGSFVDALLHISLLLLLLLQLPPFSYGWQESVPERGILL